jgi:hypothetical protein
MNYDSQIKRLTLETNFQADVPKVEKVPNRRELISWIHSQKSWLSHCPSTTLVNNLGQPISSNIFTKFYSSDANFSGQLRSIDFSEYGFDLKTLGEFRGRSGSQVGLMNRMQTSFGDLSKSSLGKVSPADRSAALDLIKVDIKDDLREDIIRLCEASEVHDFYDLSKADMTTSAGPRYYTRLNSKDTFAAKSQSKNDVMASYGEEVYSDMGQLMKVCSSGDDRELSRLVQDKPSLFAFALRGKEEVVNLHDPAKCRPYWAVDIAHVLLASIIFDLVYRAIVPFWKDRNSMSALGFNWFHDKETGTNGTQKLFEFLESTKEGETNSLGYGDDCLFARREKGKLYVSGPDVSHLDMSIQSAHFLMMREFIDKVFLKAYPDYNKSWVKGYIKLYLALAEKHAYLLFPCGLVCRKNTGLPSGIPGTTTLDLIAMSLFHFNARKTWSVDGSHFAVAGLQSGFLVKEGTSVIECLDLPLRKMDTKFLGNKIVSYGYPGLKEPLSVPVNDLINYMKTALYPKYPNPSSNAETAAWHMLRLYGISISGGLFYHEFSSSGFAAFESHKKVLIKDPSHADAQISSGMVESFSVSGVSYIATLVGKKFRDIALPRTNELLALYYPALLSRILTTVDPVYKREPTGSVVGDTEVSLNFNLFGEDEEESQEVSAPHEFTFLAETFVEPEIPPQEKKNPIVKVKRKGNPVDFKLDNLVIKFLQEKHPNKYDNYLRMLTMKDLLDKMLTDPEDMEIFEPVVEVYNDIVKEFAQAVQAKYVEEVVDSKKKERENERDKILKILMEIKANLSWGSTPNVFPLTTGETLTNLSDKTFNKNPKPVKEKEKQREGIVKEHRTVTTAPDRRVSPTIAYLNSLSLQKWKLLRDKVLIKMPLTLIEQGRLDQVSGKEEVTFMIEKIATRIGPHFKEAGPRGVNKYFDVPMNT